MGSRVPTRLERCAEAAAVALLALLALVVGGLLDDVEPAGEVMTGATLPAPCAEDMPCWDCSTMGNLACGAVDP